MGGTQQSSPPMTTAPSQLDPAAAELRDALRTYVRTAMQVLQAACPDGPPEVIVGTDEWRRDSDGVFRLYDQKQPLWVTGLWRLDEQLHGSPDYARVLAALRATPYANELLDQLVGTGSSQFRLDAAQIADRVIWDMAHAHGLGFDDERFAQAFQSLDVDLRRREFTQVSLVPLLGATVATPPVALSSDLEIDRMTDAEIGLCLSVGMLPNEFAGRLRLRRHLPEVAIRFQHKEPLHIGEIPLDSSGMVKRYAAITDRLLGVLAALRVFKGARVSIPGMLHFGSDWPVKGSTQFTFANPGFFPWANKYSLDPDEVPRLCSLWQKVEPVVTGGGALANAIRRFSYASERERPDDALVDYMIAAESLFLSEINTPDRGEMRYRLSHRAALFIPSEEYRPREVFAFMRRAYDARSTIVHGGNTPDATVLKSPNGMTMTLHDFTQLTGGLIRQALQKAILDSNARGKLAVDWDSLLFPASPSAATEA